MAMKDSWMDNDRSKLVLIYEIMDYIIAKYEEANWKIDDSWSDSILNNIWNKFHAAPKVLEVAAPEVPEVAKVMAPNPSSDAVRMIGDDVKMWRWRLTIIVDGGVKASEE
ncbi:hypothetical protein Tco_0940326 [Tanacetum coccineum]|uniref:Uncharacterized protein n=1 Tax=Tanacetum coccineum TaxID=301880 RepID=A0ABQ5DMP6_9ASTR